MPERNFNRKIIKGLKSLFVVAFFVKKKWTACRNDIFKQIFKIVLFLKHGFMYLNLFFKN